MRLKSVMLAVRAGDPRMTMGALDDLAAAALVYRARVETDLQRPGWR
jgi:hypothetical protein